ncbi:MAG: hypothetical protein E7171_03315 [Firmicutes bacterium]|nr:hypothetical protein [Bacillota bacterium]
MICSKCKKEVQGHKSICPHCKSLFIPEVEKNTNNKQIRNNMSNILEKEFSNNKDIFNVGGMVDGGKTTTTKQTTNKTITSSKDTNKKGLFTVVKDSKKNNNLSEQHKKTAKEINAKTYTLGRVKRAPKVSLALLKSEGHEQVKHVGSKTTKHYGNPIMKGGISKYGKLIKVEFVGREKRKNNGFSTGDIFYYMIIITIWVLVIGLIFNISGVDYYFDESGNQVGDNTATSGIDYSGYDGVSKSGQEGTTSALGKTKIVYDNQYFKMFTLHGIGDVYEVIRTDSLKQKQGCPANIINIENQIINNYGIVAVNLCEMDEEFANEIKNVVAYIYNNYPTARNYLTNITLANVASGSSYMAAFMPIFTFVTSDTGSGYPVGSKTQIILNANYYLNLSKINNSVSYGSKSGYFPPNATRSSTVAHEFGHYLSYVALLNYYQSSKLNYVTTGQASKLYNVYDDFNTGNFSRILLEEAYEEYIKVYGNNLTFLGFRESISKYAVAKDNTGSYIYDETIAEAFHDCYINGNNAKPASRMIMKVLNTKL